MDILFPEEILEISSDVNGWVYRADRWADFIDPDYLESFSVAAGDLAEQSDDISVQLALVNACMDISQKLVYESSTTENKDVKHLLPWMHDQLRTVLDKVRDDVALTSLMKQGVSSFFDLYEEHPDLIVDNPLRNYELDVLGPVLSIYSDEQENEFTQATFETSPKMGSQSVRQKIIHGQPVLIAKDIVGFRGIDERLSWAAKVENSVIDGAVPYSFDEYYELDVNMQDYLSGTDYDLVVANSRRSIDVGQLSRFSDFTENISLEQSRRLQELYRPHTMMVIEARLGVSLHEIPLNDQLLLLDFMSTRGQDEFDRLTSVMQSLDQESRLTMFQDFIALEQGEEFGEVLLDIAEKAESHERKELLSSILDLRRYAKSFGAAFSEYNPEFGKSIETASIKRITEALIVVDALLKGETPEATLYNGETIAVVDLSEVTEALRLLKAGYASLEQTLSGSSDEVKKEAHGEQIVIHPTIPGSQVQLRKYGGERYPDVGFDGEARINFLFSTNHKDIPLDVSNPQREQALSIRIDREGIIRDSDGNFVSTDPTIRQGSVSLDIGSIYGEKDNPNVKVGRILALGNALINAKRGKKPMFNHIREAFSPRYGDSEEFARIVAYLEQKLA